MAKKKKAKSAKTKRKKTGLKTQAIMVFVIMAAILMLPTTFLLCIGMLPTPAAFLVDRTRNKSKVVSVGAMNLAGCSPFLIDLWMNGNGFEKSFDIVTNPKAIIVMYSAAALGYLINWALGGIVSSFLYEKAKSRQKAILKEQEELVKRWGREVTGEIPLDEHGFALESEDSATQPAAKA